MLFQAHRGVSTEYPENTMPAFQAAYEQGYQVIELDPTFTADEKCIIFHDATINRTCRTKDGAVIAELCKVSDLSYDALLKYDAGIFMGPQFKGTKVPLLKEALDFAVDTSLLVKLDNKFEAFTPHLKEIFFRIIEESGARVAFTCANFETIRNVAKRFPKAKIHYDGLVDEPSIITVKSLLNGNPLTVWLPLASKLTDWVKVPTANQELCELVKRHAKLGLWILETEEQLAEAIAFGADIIETTGAVKPC